MRYQQVTVDVCKMLVTATAYLALAFAAWVLLRLVSACISLPAYLRKQEEEEEAEERRQLLEREEEGPEEDDDTEDEEEVAEGAKGAEEQEVGDDCAAAESSNWRLRCNVVLPVMHEG
ncbi:APC membrane recruitment protein 1 [Thrips palmi]|uniref:APC membrane recruitment protein 1 n=1 Tax=Thrips palmi TaxID=161013 RepID=A0A6P8ZTF8_THRPL|nr:APC membrane recruitment protein 1 [Thrips palmi]